MTDRGSGSAIDGRAASGGGRRPRWEIIVFAVLWLMLCGFFSIGTLRGMVAQRDAAARYLPAEAIVVKADVMSTYTKVRNQAGRMRYQPALTYAYDVGGRRFASARYYLDGAGEWTDLDQARQTAVANPVGSKIQVFYDPDNPAQSVVSLAATSSMVLWVDAAFWLFGFALLFLGIRGRRSSKSGVGLASGAPSR